MPFGSADMKPYTKTSETSPPVVADDLLTEIFLLLPIKSLIRFQSVSKHWQSLMTNPKFHKLRNSSLNPLYVAGLIFPIPKLARGISRAYAHVVLFDHSSTPVPKLQFTHTSASPSDIKIVSTCHGLLVVAVKEFLCSAWDHYVYNPTINQYSKLPKPDEKIIFSTQYWMYLAFAPSRSHHYKIVYVRENLMMGKYMMEVYSSETGFWKKLGKSFTKKLDFERGVYCKGAIHWIGFNKTEKSFFLNPDNGRIRVMPTPPILDVGIWATWPHCYYFEKSGVHLHFVDVYDENEFNVYEMRRDYSEWFVKFKVVLPLRVRNACSTICSVFRGNSDDKSFLVLNVWGKIVRFNPVFRTWQMMHEFKESDVGGHDLVNASRSKEHVLFRPADYIAPPDAVVPLNYIVSLCSV